MNKHKLKFLDKNRVTELLAARTLEYGVREILKGDIKSFCLRNDFYIPNRKNLSGLEINFSKEINISINFIDLPSTDNKLHEIFSCLKFGDYEYPLWLRTTFDSEQFYKTLEDAFFEAKSKINEEHKPILKDKQFCKYFEVVFAEALENKKTKIEKNKIYTSVDKNIVFEVTKKEDELFCSLYCDKKRILHFQTSNLLKKAMLESKTFSQAFNFLN